MPRPQLNGRSEDGMRCCGCSVIDFWPVFLILIKVEVCNVLVMPLSELFEQPGLAYLPDSFQNERLPIG